LTSLLEKVELRSQPVLAGLGFPTLAASLEQFLPQLGTKTVQVFP
jgi:hypothetical protein